MLFVSRGVETLTRAITSGNKHVQCLFDPVTVKAMVHISTHCDIVDAKMITVLVMMDPAQSSFILEINYSFHSMMFNKLKFCTI